MPALQTQLPLPMRLRSASVFDTYCAGDNQPVVDTLQQLPSVQRSPVVVLYGPSGVGKSHLLQALCAAASLRGEAASYLPLNELADLGPEVLTSAAAPQWVCVDDWQRVVADRAWNLALFSLHRELEERGAKLVLASNAPPAALPFALPDLSSRILAGTVLRLRWLSEAKQIQALRMHATQRGFELPDDVAQYLLRHLPRDMGRLCRLIDELDEALLAAQRRLSIPFVRQWLQALPARD